MSRPTIAFADVRLGQTLPPLSIPVTVTSIMAAALATRDYQPVHFDVDRARAHGSASVFTNTHTTAGYLERLVVEWAGANSFLKSLKLRLGAPNHPGDTLVLSGTVTALDPTTRSVSIAVTGRNPRGDHVTADVVVRFLEAVHG